MLEVDPFAAGHELERHFAVKVEMPQVTQQPDGFPIADAREERVHQDESIDFRRVLRGVGVRDHQSDVVPHHLSLA